MSRLRISHRTIRQRPHSQLAPAARALPQMQDADLGAVSLRRIADWFVIRRNVPALWANACDGQILYFQLSCARADLHRCGAQAASRPPYFAGICDRTDL